MMQKSGTNQSNAKATMTALLINVLTALICIFVFNPTYETNDDNGLIAIAEGVRGFRDAHLVHTNYLFGRLITILYAAYQNLQWWSVIQFALLFISLTVIAQIFIRRLPGIAGKLFTISMVFFFSYEGYSCIQYTKSAGIICAAGLMSLFHGLLAERKGSDSEKGEGKAARIVYILSGIMLTIIGSFYRFQEFCCIIAVFASMVVYLIMYHIDESEESKKCITKAFIIGAILLVLAGGLRVYDRAQYKSDEWAAYLEFDKYRTEVLDYGVPDYEEHEDEYNAVGIDKTAYKLMKNWTFQDSEKFTADTFKTIAGFRDKKSINGGFIKEFARDFAKGLLKGRTFYCLLISLLGWLVVGSRRKRNFVSLLVLALVIIAINFYLYYAGRFMFNRVDVGIWLAATMIVLYQYKAAGKEEAKSKAGIVRTATLVVCCMLMMATFIVRMPWQDSLKTKSAKAEEEKMKERSTIELVSKDKEHLYLTKIGILKFSQAYGVMDVVPYQIADNIYPLGGWGSETPVFKSVLENYGVSNPFRDMIGNEKVLLVDDDIEDTIAYLRRWYKSDVEAELTDTINGHKIYKIK